MGMRVHEPRERRLTGPIDATYRRKILARKLGLGAGKEIRPSSIRSAPGAKTQIAP